MPAKPSSSEKFINQVCQNTKSDLIEITEDKLENILMKFIKSVKKSNSWITPFSLVITIAIALSTADVNKDFIGIKKEYWTAMFYIALIVCICWTIINMIQSIYNSKKAKVENVIQKIKNT